MLPIGSKDIPIGINGSVTCSVYFRAIDEICIFYESKINRSKKYLVDRNELIIEEASAFFLWAEN